MPGWPTRLSLVHILGYCNSTHLLASLHLSVYVCVCVDACVCIYPFFFAKSKALLEIEKTVAIRQQEQAKREKALEMVRHFSELQAELRDKKEEIQKVEQEEARLKKEFADTFLPSRGAWPFATRLGSRNMFCNGLSTLIESEFCQDVAVSM